MQNITTHSNSLSSQVSPEKDQQLPHLRQKAKKKKSKHPLLVNLLDCKYMVVRQVVKDLKFAVTRDSQGQWDLTWTDNMVTPETLVRMKPHQKINHFPGMFNLSRKNYLARNLNKMQKYLPSHYDFYPKTWVLPSQYTELKQFLENQPNPVVIAKPEAGCQGRGIFLCKNIEEFNFGEHYVVQKYLKKPFLIEGLKFDLRVYVLIAGCDPLRVYIYKEGLARFATETYSTPKKQNFSNLFMHLTNYAINKASNKFEFNRSSDRMDIGHKRSLSSILHKIKELGHDSEVLWQQICLIITKTIISVQPILAHTYRSCQPDNIANNMCFQLLGFDVMLDHQLKPIILEVNYTPSFSTDTPLDTLIKENLIKDTLVLMNVTNRAKNDALSLKKREILERTLTGKKLWKNKEERELEVKKITHKRDSWEEKHIGNFERIFPLKNEEKNQQMAELLEQCLKYSEAGYLADTGANIKRNTKVNFPSKTTSELSESQVPKSAQSKFTRTHQLERIYMKKSRPMVISKGQNRSQIKEEKEGEEKRRDSAYSKGEFVRNRGYESVEKVGGGGLKYEANRVSTLDKFQSKQEQETIQSKGGRSALARVYNVGFREMKATR